MKGLSLLLLVPWRLIYSGGGEELHYITCYRHSSECNGSKKALILVCYRSMPSGTACKATMSVDCAKNAAPFAVQIEQSQTKT